MRAVTDHLRLRRRATPSAPVRCALAAACCALVACTSGACSPSATAGREATTLPPPAGRRAIVVSFDSFNEARLRSSLDRAATPTLHAIFDSAACATYAVPAFPTVTPPGHASLWTGAYGNVSGITANTQPVLPRNAHTLLESISGFAAQALRAEPIWIAAARIGRVVVGHHVTQAPGPPGYPAIDSEADSAPIAARERGAQALARPNVHVVNGYNSYARLPSPALVLDERTTPPRAAAGWRGLERLGEGTLPPFEIAWQVGTDSVFGLFHGRDRYTRILIARERDTRNGVVAEAVPAARSALTGRALARFFSEALELPAGRGRIYLRGRLFALAPDASSFLLFQPALPVVQANRPEVAAAYDAAVRGWVGNGADELLREGRFGPPLTQGGDGTAEARWLESLEYLTRQSMRGAEWAWRTLRPSLLLDYFPVGDETDHLLYGYVVPASPHYNLALARRIQAVRNRAWALVDRRLAHLRRLAAEGSATALFVAGDHGMRAEWRVFRPNVALAQAGLLATDSGGQIDLARTRALSPNGYWVMVNRAAWKGGTVPPGEEAAIIAAAERALREARGPDGAPIVTAVYRASEHDSLGLGGPAGGDLYYEVAPGYRWLPEASGPVAADAERPGAGHGYPPVSPDMRTVFCAAGGAFAPRRIGGVRTIDVAPTVAEWLGMSPPADARGRSVLAALLEQSP